MELRMEFTHRGRRYVAVSPDLVDTDYGPETRVHILDAETGARVATRQEPATMQMIVEWWKREDDDDAVAREHERYQDEMAFGHDGSKVPTEGPGSPGWNPNGS